MIYVVYKELGFFKECVIGQFGVFDMVRFRIFVVEELNLLVKDVIGFVFGGYGDDMVLFVCYFYVGGILFEIFILKEWIDVIVECIRKGGGEIVNFFGNGSVYYVFVVFLIEMVEVILKDQCCVFFIIVYFEGEYGYEGIYFGVFIIVGGNGFE